MEPAAAAGTENRNFREPQPGTFRVHHRRFQNRLRFPAHALRRSHMDTQRPDDLDGRAEYCRRDLRQYTGSGAIVESGKREPERFKMVQT